MKKVLVAGSYFARPYLSWEPGLNENHLGLMCQYLPKCIALDKITVEDIILI
ncbi:MAG: IS30 family transposase [Pseudohongiellaceae bacterium]|jgi:IS30 family transposase